MAPTTSTRRPRLLAGGLAAALAAAGILTVTGPADAGAIPTPVPGTVDARIVGTDLEVTGTAAADRILLRLRAGDPDTLEIAVGPTRAAAFRFRRSSFDRIVVHAGAGDDAVSIDESAGIFTDTEATTLDGGEGGDRLTGGGGAEVLVGDADPDIVDGNGGADVALLGPGDDAMAWSPGDGNDLIEGQGGEDAVTVTGSASSEHVDVSAVGSRVRLFRDAQLVTLDMAGITRLGVQAAAGSDVVTIGDLTGTALGDLTVDLAATPGGTTGDGQGDKITVNGGATADDATITPSPGRVDVAGLAAAVHVVAPDGPNDQLAVNGGAGTDAIHVATAVTAAMVVSADGGAGADLVLAEGTPEADTIGVSAPAGRVRVSDAPGRFFESTAETTIVSGLAGADTITVSEDVSALTNLEADGGDGDDVLFGSVGAEVLAGGNGRDVVRGGQGADTAVLGPDDDRFEWATGDGDDVVLGSGGLDSVSFEGAAGPEDAGLSNIGAITTFEHVLHTNGVHSEIMLKDVEAVRYSALGASDFIGVQDMSTSSVKAITFDLAGTPGGTTGDGGNDMIFVQGTQGTDAISVSGTAAAVHIGGLPASIDLTRVEFPNEQLDIETLNGNDTVNTAQLAPNTINITVH
jgi:Ca2+-binding RTX toxin-like protein